jgi:hypothetical protein
MKVLLNCEGSKVTEPQFIAASDLVFAIEASLPEADVPDWESATLRQLILLMLRISFPERFSHQRLDSRIAMTPVISYKETHGLKDLSKKTLTKCLESMSVQVQHTLPGFEESKGHKVEAVSWSDKLGSFELL